MRPADPNDKDEIEAAGPGSDEEACFANGPRGFICTREPHQEGAGDGNGNVCVRWPRT